MPKAGEIAYLQMVGEASVQHALNKPFSDPRCGQYLIALGAMRTLLPPPPARLLDLGCGTGWSSCLLAKMGYEVVGQDISARTTCTSALQPTAISATGSTSATFARGWW